ncbi:type II toxin-antitoxin system RelE/ParE family toxin [Candidatus Woesearchaeota archaeon]|nr:type II toxin-antitoxin system RelE/ParE family toxin [Candidatus Woesearchaeota archaeon]
MYELVISDLAKRQLSKLPQDIKDRMGKSLDRIKARPHHFVLRLTGSPYYRLRVGDYRVIMDIKEQKMIILVLELGHRRNIYE